MVIKINDEIGMWGITVANIESQLNEANSDIEVYVDSPGGSVVEGVRIYNAIKRYDKGSVTVVIGAMAASIATYIAMAGDVIKAHDNSTFMIHNAWGVTIGDYRDMQKSAEVLEGLTSLIARKYIEKSGKSEAEIRKLMDEETFFFGEEIEANGFADEIIATSENKDSQAAIALAQEQFKACLRHMKEKEEDASKEQIAAILKESGLDKEKRMAKLRLAKAKLKLLQKEHV